jgi:uncharacterized repeat protein (TIGR03803 family)
LANSRRFRSLTLGLSVGAATGALAVAIVIVFVLTVVAGPAAQAQTFHVIHTFTGKTDGGKPFAGVTIDKSGNLYGTTYAYGNPKGPDGANWGVVYRWKPGGTFNTLYTFTDGKDGAFPAARVIFGPNGTLYGTTQGSGEGSSPYGTVFNLKPPATCTISFCPWKITTLYAFKGKPDCNGQTSSYGDLAFDKLGNIYGTTYSGGANGTYGEGCVFKLTPSATGGYTEKVIYSFGGTAPGEGRYPFAGVIVDKDGNLYGTTSEGGRTCGTYGGTCGTVYELMPSSGGYKEKQLYLFTGANDGGSPFGGVIFDSLGNLYGSTENAGLNGAGTAFKLTSEGNGNWSYDPLYSFSGASGNFCGPYGNLAFDGAGNLYGTTSCSPGTYGDVFKLTPGGTWTYTSLHNFSGGSDGANPISNVTIDANGNLYGTDSEGANATCYDSAFIAGCGVVWKITP